MVDLLLNLAFLSLSALIDIKLYNAVDIQLPTEVGQVVGPVIFREEGYTLLDADVPPDADGKCKYTGLVVGYERNWTEAPGVGDEKTIPAEPGKLAGFAVLLNKKTCPGQAAEPIFRVANARRAWIFGRDRFQKGRFLIASSVEKDKKPRWLPQVLSAIEKSSATFTVAKELFDDLKTRAQAAKLAESSTTALGPIKAPGN